MIKNDLIKKKRTVSNRLDLHEEIFVEPTKNVCCTTTRNVCLHNSSLNCFIRTRIDKNIQRKTSCNNLTYQTTTIVTREYIEYTAFTLAAPRRARIGSEAVGYRMTDGLLKLSKRKKILHTLPTPPGTVFKMS